MYPGCSPWAQHGRGRKRESACGGSCCPPQACVQGQALQRGAGSTEVPHQCHCGGAVQAMALIPQVMSLMVRCMCASFATQGGETRCWTRHPTIPPPTERSTL